MMVKKIPLNRGQVAIVDDDDYERLSTHKWFARLADAKYPEHGYIAYYNPSIGHRKTKTVKMHRLIINAPPGTYVDHINGNKLDNRKCNLRLSNNQLNQANAIKRGKFTSKYKGVSRSKKRGGCWTAQIMWDRKQHNLGYFDTEEEAARAYDKAAFEHFGYYARLNFREALPCAY